MTFGKFFVILLLQSKICKYKNPLLVCFSPKTIIPEGVLTCQLSVKAYSHKGFSRFLFVSRVSIVSSKGKNQKTCSGKQVFLVLLLRFFSTLPGMVSEHFPAEVRIIFFIKKLSRAKNFLRKFFSWILDNFSLKKCFSITSRKNAKLNEHWETKSMRFFSLGKQFFATVNFLR